MVPLRRALCDHLEATRAFASKAIGVDSGIYDVNQLGSVLEDPDTIVRLETTWIEELLEVLQIIQRYVSLVERWANHIYGLERNLGIKEGDGLRIQRHEASAVDLLAAKTLDKDYLQWVLADTADEVDRLTAANAHLLTEVPRLLDLVQRFGGVYLDQVGQVTQAWTTGGRFDFPRQLITAIEEAYAETSVSGTLQRLGRYLDIMITVVTSTPVFSGTTPSTLYTPSLWASRQELVDQLLRRCEELKEFVARRTQTYMPMVRHQQALLQAVLPSDHAVEQWLIAQYTDPTATVDQVLPPNVATDTLPLAIEQAEELLTDWYAAVETALPHFQNALRLNEILQSPAVSKFLAADQERLDLYREWRPKMQATFDTLRRAAQHPASERER